RAGGHGIFGDGGSDLLERRIRRSRRLGGGGRDPGFDASAVSGSVCTCAAYRQIDGRRACGRAIGLEHSDELARVSFRRTAGTSRIDLESETPSPVRSRIAEIEDRDAAID